MTNKITRLPWPLVALLAGFLWLSACQDPTSLGTDLLDEDRVGIGFIDTLAVRAITVRPDSVVTYTPSLSTQLSSYLFGDFRDPVFGQAESSIYFQVRPERLTPDFTNTRLDSVVLVLPYDTTGFYGPARSNTFGIEVRRVTENMPRTEVYYSNASFATDPVSIGGRDFQPSTDSIRVVRYVSATVRDTIRFPHLRVALDPAFGQALLRLDTNLLKTDSAFLSYLPGLHVRPTRSTESMISFALNSSPYRGGVYVYYTQNDTIRRQFQFAIDEFSTRLTHYEHDYAGTAIARAIDNPGAGDSLLYLQGMAGVNTEIELLGYEEYAGLIVNKAELEVSLAPAVMGDTTAYRPAERFLLSVREADGDLVLVRDIVILINNRLGTDAFGGVRNPQTNIFRMNISAYFQDLLAGRTSNRLVITLVAASQTARRVALYGAKDPVRGIKLRLAYSRL